MIRDLGLPVEKIHACRNGCMLYWKDDIDMEYCKFCGDPRYLPLTPRLQRLYASPATAEHMTWHASHVTEEDSIVHPSDAEAWRHFDRTHPNFALEPRNIRLGLCIDGFAPHGQYGRTYSCWPVAHVEASIVEAYIVEEIGWFTSHYFEPHVTCKRRQPSRNDDLTREHERISRDIFNHPGPSKWCFEEKICNRTRKTYDGDQSLGRRPLAANHQLALAPAPPPALIPVTAKPRAAACRC
ncbi:UNVERIFIED_CONTAM: hypothetical protein Sangu_2571300 [Sesamum angustifolium]|uniref:Uncharacterized protein n=1 Tax=Sesamum angustifolium TaxID=2727405 RepID=A0AAW2J7G5_9LAMI